MKKLFVLVIVAAILFVAPLAHGQVFGNIHRVIFPQIAYGGGWSTTIVVTNVSQDPLAQVTLGFGAQDGSNLYVNIGGKLTAAHNPAQILPGASKTIVLTSAETDPIVAGWMLAMIERVPDEKGVISDAIQVLVTYAYAPAEILSGQATVIPVGTPSLKFGIQAVRKGDSDTGVAVANPNGIPAIVRIQARNMVGQIVAVGEIFVPAHGQVAKFITEILPQLKSGWNGGFVEFTSDQNVAGMSLLMTGGVFSTGNTF